MLKITPLLLLLALATQPAAAHEPRFYLAGSENTTVEIREPHISQAFYETLHRHQHVSYVFAEKLMHTNEEATFLFELILPDSQSPALCAGVRVDVQVPGHPDHTYTLDGLGQDYTKLFEPFVQEPLVRVGEQLRYKGLFDTKEGFLITAHGPTNHSACNLAIVVGNEERLSATTLVLYPYISFMVWGWLYVETEPFWLLFLLLPACLALLMMLCIASDDGDESERRAGWPYLLQLTGFSFFVGVWFTRIYAFARAGSYGAHPSASDVGWAIGIVLVDTFFVVVVGVNLFAERFQNTAGMCLDTFCCTRWLSCTISCMKDAEEVRGLFVFYILLLLGAIFAFSPGFFIGPFLVLLGLALVHCPCEQRQACHVNCLRTTPTINYRIWA